jgi:hypothetical protein
LKIGPLCIPPNCVLGHIMLMQDWFAEGQTYLAYLFHRQYRMRHLLFVKVVETCVAKTWYFKCRRNAARLLGFSGYKKISAAMRVLAYGIWLTIPMSTFASVKILPSSRCVGFAKWWFVS